MDHQDDSITPADPGSLPVDSSSGSDHVHPVIAEWMELWDEILAQQDVPPHDRPLRAALMLARDAVVQVSTHGLEEDVPDDVTLRDVISKPWFGRLVRVSEAWYDQAFGPKALRPPELVLSGAIVYRGAIQVVRIPGIIEKRAELHYQKWIAFPDHVEGDEDVLSWIRPGFERGRMPRQALADVELAVRRVAGAVRFIASRARNASRGSMELRGFLAGAVKSLVAFPDIAAADNLERQKAWWELQMANESLLKAFCVQKGRPGGYRKVHSLPRLIRDAAELGLDYLPDKFSGWPSPADISAFRYSTGPRVTSSELFSAYELTLSLCEVVAASLDVKFDTGKGRMLIQPLPWRLRELGIEARTESVRPTIGLDRHPTAASPSVGGSASQEVTAVEPSLPSPLPDES